MISPVGGKINRPRFGSGWVVTLPFGVRYWLTKTTQSYHPGIDLILNGARAENRPLYAITDGEVLFADRVKTPRGGFTTWGNLTVIHGDNIVYRYGHQSEMYVKAGQKVFAGQIIGRLGGVGKTLRYYVPHLHFDMAVSDYGVNMLRTYPTYWPYMDLKSLSSVFVDPEKYTFSPKVFDGKKAIAEVALNCRNGPGTKHKIMSTLYSGERVTILEESGEWSLIAETGYWSSKGFLNYASV